METRETYTTGTNLYSELGALMTELQAEGYSIYEAYEEAHRLVLELAAYADQWDAGRTEIVPLGCGANVQAA